MALTKPTLFSVPAFDAEEGITFKFEAVGGAQVVANELIIRLNETNTIIYSKKINSFKFEHKLLPGILTNNTYYNATITTFDRDGYSSPQSTPIQFWCYKTPTITLTNIPPNNLVGNSSFEVEFEYNQVSLEKLNSYKVNLYDSSNTLIHTSGVKYVLDSYVPYVNRYTFNGLEDNSIYYIEVEGNTVNDTKITTGLVEIIVKYIQPDFFSVLEVVNNCDEGYVTIKSNAYLVDGVSNPSPPRYLYNKEVDLTDEGSWVEFNEGFTISKNFLARIWFRSAKQNMPIITFTDTKWNTITVYYREGYEDDTEKILKAYVDVYVEPVHGKPYYIYSGYAPLATFPTDYYNVWLTRDNDLFSVVLAPVL